MAIVPVPEEGKELLADLKVPPRGIVSYHREIWQRSHESVYVVQVRSLDDAEDWETILTTVVMAAAKDAADEGLDFTEILADAQDMLDSLEDAPE